MKLVTALFIATRLLGQTCAQCHGPQTAGHKLTSMANAMQLPADCVILKNHPKLTFRQGKYSYEIVRQRDTSIYKVTDGSASIAVPIGWAFGLGTAGQTYVFRYEGNLYESRISFFQDIDGLDFTLGAAGLEPHTLIEAAGRLMGAAESKQCFDCHTTNSTPGIQCQRCHGPTANHLTSLSAMPRLGKMNTEETSNFCGQCHRTWEQIAGGGPLGIGNIRFQPYRLTNSKCYDTEDKRIACTACHNPHKQLVTTLASYDRNCLACHAGVKAKGKTCPVAVKNCASCHMPKLELPGSHHQFTDHQIRIAKAGAPYPN